MCRSVAATIALAAAVLALGGTRTMACGAWFFCDASDYPPMIAPAQDGRVGPVWGTNGWSYPQHYGDAEHVRYPACDGQPYQHCRGVRARVPPLHARPMK